MLIIGGSDAGISAAVRAREIDPDVDVTMVLADQYPNFSICGLPFFLTAEKSPIGIVLHIALAKRSSVTV